MAQETKTNTLAIVSLILGIISVPALGCFGCGGLVFGVAAFITGLVARRRIAESQGAETGKGLALVGIILGAIGALVGLFFGLALIVMPGMTLLGPGVQELFDDIVRQLGAQ